MTKRPLKPMRRRSRVPMLRPAARPGWYKRLRQLTSTLLLHDTPECGRKP